MAQTVKIILEDDLDGGPADETVRFGLDGAIPQTLEEVGVGLGITRERVRQLESRALRELRMVGGEAEAARIDDLIGELAHPMPLQEFDAKREDLERAVREHRADEPRRAANRLECTLEYDNPGASPSPSP